MEEELEPILPPYDLLERIEKMDAHPEIKEFFRTLTVEENQRRISELHEFMVEVNGGPLEIDEDLQDLKEEIAKDKAQREADYKMLKKQLDQLGAKIEGMDREVRRAEAHKKLRRDTSHYT